MSETGSLIKFLTHEARTTDKTVWYTAEEKEHKREAHWYA